MVVFQALSWEARDLHDYEHIISIIGRSDNGESVCVSTVFDPYFFIKMPHANKKLCEKIKNDLNKILQEEDVIEDAKMVKGKDVWGFQNNTSSIFIKLTFKTLKNMKNCIYSLTEPVEPEEYDFDFVQKYERRCARYDKNIKPILKTLKIPFFKLYESNIEPLLRLMHRTNISSTGWIEIETCESRDRFSRCDIDLFCDDWKKLKSVDRDDIAKFVVASFDIETYSSTGKFPDPTIKGDACFQIAFTLKRQGEKEFYDKTCLCYKKTDPIEGCNIINYDTESELLMGFRDYIIKHDIDMMTGWNIFGFDLHYIYTRARELKCNDKFYDVGRLLNSPSKLITKKLSSSALGDNSLKIVPMTGRYIFDLFHEVKREQKLDFYNLNFVSNHFLGDSKIDMSPHEMFARFVEEDPHKLMEVAEYCIKDTILPHRLMDKLCNILNLLEMAKATWVPLCYLSERGQQIKVFSQITRKARELGYMVPTYKRKKEADTYKGATVLEAQKGAYYTPITALDFASLYPSIMMAHNLCYSTLVMDPKYDNLPDVEYESFEIGEKTYKFAQNVSSLLPVVLQELKLFRKQAKKDMANATGEMKAVYNGKQLAYKISMNSVYGFTGAAKFGILPCVAIASTVTCKGRMMIDDTKQKVEEEFPGAKVRYGDTDSVMIEFDVQGRKGVEAIEYSWELGEKAATICNDLFKKPNDLELEKVYCPYFLYSKKRYAAKMWIKNRQGEMIMDQVDIKGLQVVRRDNTPFVRKVSLEVLNMILDSDDPEKPKKYAHTKALELLDGHVPMEDLILSQKLSDKYKSDNLPHVQVRNKMREREPGSEPKSGDRIPFVLIKTKNNKAKAFEKSEDPKWVKKKNLPIDYWYYFANKFINPVCDILEPLVENPKHEIFGDLISQEPVRNVAKGQRQIDDIFKKFEDKK